MNWELRFDERVADRIAAWARAIPALGPALLARLQNDLTTDPQPYLGEMIVPTTNRQYAVIFNGVPGIPDGLRCTFALDVDEAAHRITFVGARMNTPGREF